MKRKQNELFSDLVIGIILLGLGALIIILGHSTIVFMILGGIIALIGLFILNVFP